MRRFHYTVTNEKGARKKGAIHASSEKDAVEKLQKKGLLVISVREDVKKKQWFWQRPRLSFQEKVMFTKHLATMIRVGISITEALQILKDQAKSKNNRKMYENITKMVESGQTLSDSLRNYEDVFSSIFINMVATGEEGGTLDQVLEYLDKQLEKEYDLRKKIFSAFVYPAVIIAITILLVLGVVIFIIPKIAEIFTSFNADLPLPTRILIGTSTFMIQHPFQTIAMTLGTIGISSFLLKTKHLKPFWHRLVLHLPVFGKLLVYANLARFARTLHSLMEAGVPITKALLVVSNMFTNDMYKKATEKGQAKVEKGGQLGPAFEGNGKLFPTLVTKMLFIGEKSGSLETATEHLAVLYEKNVDSLTKNLSVLLEPILLVFMGGLIGGVAISITLPIYQLPNLLS
jgi:type IV pilus assembly protein PilC